MPTLQNPKREAFCQALAQGKSAFQAYKTAGFRPDTGNAVRLAGKDGIQERCAEIKEAQVKATEAPPDTYGRDPASGEFLKGYSRGGRPVGSRVKLAESFLADLHSEWRQSGPAVLTRLSKEEPATLAKLVASVLPRIIDTNLSIDVDMFVECRNFGQAWNLARQTIGADDMPLLIEGDTSDEQASTESVG